MGTIKILLLLTLKWLNKFHVIMKTIKQDIKSVSKTVKQRLVNVANLLIANCIIYLLFFLKCFFLNYFIFIFFENYFLFIKLHFFHYYYRRQ